MVGERIARRSIALALLAVGGCHRSSPALHDARPAVDPTDAVAADLDAFEDARRKATDFSAVPPWSKLAGADPYRIEPLSISHPHAVGILRGASSIVLLDGALHEEQRLDAPYDTTGLAVSDTEIVVSGNASPVLARFRFDGARLTPAGSITLSGVLGIRDVALGTRGVVYATDERNGSLVVLETSEGSWKNGRAQSRRDLPAGIAPFRVAATRTHVVVDDLLGHALLSFSLDAHGLPAPSPTRIHHDGPIWSFDARERGGDLFIAAGGVEDRSLDRSRGFFGWIDSFAFLYRVRDSAPTRIAAVNLGELGVVTPKAIVLDVDRAAGASMLVTGYGGERAARLTWERDDFSEAPSVSAFSLAPGTAAIARSDDGYLVANTLLDTWSIVRPNGFGEMVAIPNGAPHRSSASRIGEALFFTTILAPGATSDGEHSRFTCETCHFEGYVDGRTHFTGRGDVFATTKPLRGLLNNRPHFSRALDPDLATVALNEFRVANAGTGESEWFALKPADFPFLRDLGASDDVLSADDLRRAFMSFLMDFSHDENPATLGRSSFTPEEESGADLFRARCETCHEARTASDVASSRVPFDAWERAIFSEDEPIVWARDTYEKTGVEPYVHENGARVPSLRRSFRKRPYFTNGSALDIASVLDRARFDESAHFFHAGGPPSATGLSDAQKRDLAAFLALL